MKNPFERDHRKTLIAVIAIASVTAGALAFFFLSDKGGNARKGLKKKIKGIAKDAVADAISKKTKISKKAIESVANHVVK